MLTSGALQIDQHLGHHRKQTEEGESDRAGGSLCAVATVGTMLLACIYRPIASCLPTGRTIGRVVLWLAIEHSEYRPSVHMPVYLCRIFVISYFSFQPMGNSYVVCLVGERSKCDRKQYSPHERNPEGCEHYLGSIQCTPCVPPLAYFLAWYRSTVLTVTIAAV